MWEKERDRVPYLFQLTGYIRSNRPQIPSLNIEQLCFSYRNCISGHPNHLIMWKDIFLYLKKKKSTSNAIIGSLNDYWGQEPSHDPRRVKRTKEGWGNHNANAWVNQHHWKGDGQIFCVSWCDEYKTYNSIYEIFLPKWLYLILMEGQSLELTFNL